MTGSERAAAGAISQTITLPYAASYAISYLRAGNAGCGQQLLLLRVTWNGTVVVSHGPRRPPPWGVLSPAAARRRLAEAVGHRHRGGPVTGVLTFQSLTPGACGTPLDSIAVRQLPRLGVYVRLL